MKHPRKDSALDRRQFIAATGGLLKYDGQTMKESHKGLGLAREDFDACNAALAKALDTNGVKAADKEQLMKLVQSLMPDIVGQ